ncbi:MAG TPA: acetylxylan esterase, partial [Solibacterales bacterium]|nr:acetylxylan esterase [Bryobacterales bacterium]
MGAAQWRAYNYDESKVGTYTLPDPLVTESGKPVSTAQEWQNIRRPELV